MKKTLKSILAITLALILSFGTLTAFATENKTLTWHQYDEQPCEYIYYGEIIEGENAIAFEDGDDYSQYYSFNAKNGYYLFSYEIPADMGWLNWIGFPYEMIDGEAYDSIECVAQSYVKDENFTLTEKFIYNLCEGETVIGLDVFPTSVSKDIKLSVEYLGESVTDFDITTKDYVLNGDVYEAETEGWLYTDAIIGFSENKSVTIDYCDLQFTCDGITEGENILTFKFEGVTEEIAINVYPVDYYVSGAELSNAEKYTQEYVDYFGEFWSKPIEEEILTIFFTDSTSKDFEFFSDWGNVEFPNGRSYYFYIDRYYDYDYESEKDIRILSINIEGYCVKEYQCTITEYGFVQNGEVLIEENTNRIVSFIEDILWYFSNAFENETAGEILSSLFGSFFDSLIDASNLFNGIFKNFIIFIKYYLVG